jgi:hypothetical protein
VRCVRFHDLRHTFGTRMAASPDVAMRQIQEWMGHRDYRDIDLRGLRTGRGREWDGRPGLCLIGWPQASDAQTQTLGRPREISIPGYEDDFLIAEFERGGQVNRVIAAQPEVFSVLPGAACEPLIDADRDQLTTQLLERHEGLLMGIFSKSTHTSGSCQGGPTLGIDEDARRCGIGTAPKLCRQLGAVLDDDELNQGRGVEVEDQARCSETRSETKPVPFTCADRAERVPCGIWTRPRRARASSGRSPSPLRRATGRPRRVTTISSPSSTRSKYSLRRSCNSRTPTSLSG